MITEDYVSLEIAELLKEKGFNWEVHRSYLVNDNCFVPADVNDLPYRKDAIRIPTLQMVMKWLREVHHWHIFVVPRWEDVEYMPGEWEEEMVGYQYVILAVGEVNRKNEQPIVKALTSESAYEAAIKYCLENLI